MKPKLKFLLPDLKTANKAAEALLLARIDNKNISFIAKPGTNLGELQTASTIESTNMINDGQRGLLIGAGIGLIVGLYMQHFQPWITTTFQVHWIILLTIATVMGAIASAIGAAVFGVNLFNTDLNNYKDKIAAGAILMIVSAPLHRTNEIRKIVNNLHLKF